MCLAFVALGAHPRHPLLVVTNRDEEYERPRAPAQFWPEHPAIFAGRDLRRGGSWCGVDRSGRVALLTFYRERRANDRPLRSCGELVMRYLKGDRDPPSYLEEIHGIREQYRGFNLILGSPNALYYYSNRSEGVTRLSPGIYGVSNALLDTPWPKVERGKEALRRLLETGDPTLESACALMSDRCRAPRASLPRTGYSEDHEWALSSLFVVAPEIGEGTLATTVIRYNEDGTVEVLERSFGREAISTGDRLVRFTPSPQSAQSPL